MLKFITDEYLNTTTVIQRRSYPIMFEPKRGWHLSYKIKYNVNTDHNIVLISPNTYTGTGGPPSVGSAWICGFGKWNNTAATQFFLQTVTRSGTGQWLELGSFNEYHKIDYIYVPQKSKLHYFFDNEYINSMTLNITEMLGFVDIFISPNCAMKECVMLQAEDIGADDYTTVLLTGGYYSVPCMDYLGNKFTINGAPSLSPSEKDPYLYFNGASYFSWAEDTKISLGGQSFTIDFYYNCVAGGNKTKSIFGMFTGYKTGANPRIRTDSAYKGSTKYYSHDSSAGVTDLCGHTITTTGSPYITTDNSHWNGSLSTGYYDSVLINDVTIGGSDLTVEFWINILGDPGCYKHFMKIKDNNSDKDWNWSRHGNFNTTYYYVFGDSFGGSRGSTWGVNGNYGGTEPSYVYNTWVHVAWVYNYSDDTLKMYANGTVKGSHTGATTLRPVRTCTVWLSEYSNTYGYRSNTRNNRQLYDEFRISKCQRWTSNFTPQTGPYTKDNNTIVLCHFN